MTFIILAAIGAVAVGFVLRPVFAPPARSGEGGTERARRFARLAEKKARIYESIKDLDFEHEAGKLSETDYQTLRSDYLSQAAAVVAAMDKLASGARDGEAAAASPSAEQEGQAGERPCAACGQKNPSEARFCFRCGSEIPAKLVCPACKVELPAEARFCISCGKRVGE
jgi:hypothetical protein